MKNGVINIISKTLTIYKMNNIDKIYDPSPEIFAANYFEYLASVLRNIDLKQIEVFIGSLLDARERGVNIFFIGNGGSAATASHFANDLAIGTHQKSKPFSVISLTDNAAVITALGNDIGYEAVFEQQLRSYAKPHDVLVGISASGNSENLLRAFNFSNDIGMKTIAITAFDGGEMKKIASEGIHVPTEKGEYGPAEDAHMIIDHLVSAYLILRLKNDE